MWKKTNNPLWQHPAARLAAPSKVPHRGGGTQTPQGSLRAEAGERWLLEGTGTGRQPRLVARR